MPHAIEVDKPVTEYLRETVRRQPDAVAINFYGRLITYGELDRLIDNFAAGLMDLGLTKGDRVAIYLQNSPQFVIAYFGIMRAGCVAVCLNPMYRQAELKENLNSVTPRVLVTSDNLYKEAAKALPESSLEQVVVTSLGDFIPSEPTYQVPSEEMGSGEMPADTKSFLAMVAAENPPALNLVEDLDNDLALLQFTGGTTGVAKAAMCSHRSLALAVKWSSLWYGHTPEDVHLGLAPFFHAMGMQITMCPSLVTGGELVIMARFDAKTTADILAGERCSVWTAATPMLTAMVNLPGVENYDFSPLRKITTGGSPVSLTLQQQFQKLAPESNLCEGYGMTEILAGGGVLTPIGRWKAGYVGIPQMNDVKIVDLETGENDLPPNETGEIVIKGPTVMTGYWNKPEETEATIRDGWLYTGDIGSMDEEGYFRIIDRKKEMVICSGYNVYPTEVEKTMVSHPAVMEVAVKGVPDPYRGEALKAYVVLKPENMEGVDEEKLLAWCKENMAAYKRPREIEFRESLPKSGAGKILKRALE
jgi:acyl-CoA synthetase (AMP-forming)/AMP-acid ligase II